MPIAVLPPVPGDILQSMSDGRPLRDAAVRTVLLTVAVAVGTGLSRGGWRDAFFAAAVFAPVTFLVMWAILDRKRDG